MPTYIPKLLRKFPPNYKRKKQKSPHSWTTPTYGEKRRYTKISPTLPVLSDKQTNILQQKAGSLLYYARAMDYPMLPDLSDISITRAKPMEST